MLNINEAEVQDAIVQSAVQELLGDDSHLSGIIAKEVKARIDKIFLERANAQIASAIDEAIKDSFNREYQRVTQWGEASGPKTSIKAELQKTIDGYWSARVETRTGKPADSSYNSISRAEYIMTQICAEDFSETVKQSVLNVTGALKDGLRIQLGKQMDNMLSELFHVKSLQDQGKVEKPY
jgi:hypothetical protein